MSNKFSEISNKAKIGKGVKIESFVTISDDVEIREAELKDGLLRVSMEKIIPESRKRKEISIN